ncbi:hypothetical protein HDU76_004539 [Blyttiomyces sp. JEL0837]|nr:hypothetical protein HDU76_004539 [Blyttiomyces sp. JEL0837]
MTLASSAPDPEIMYRLGKLILLHGITDKDKSTQDIQVDGLRFLRISAELGHPQANYALGIGYRYGLTGLTPDYKKAIKYLTYAAEHDVYEAQYEVGIMYKKGYGIDNGVDYKIALSWFKSSAMKGTGNIKYMSHNEIGEFYTLGLGGLPVNYVEAVRMYQIAAVEGNLATAQYNLGDMYRYGKGVEQDYIMAYPWYWKSGSEQGYSFGQNGLGDFIIMAAEQGNSTAQNNLGGIYYSGNVEAGVEKDLGEAVKWFKMAADQGNCSDAENSLGDIYFFGGGGVKRDVALAVQFYHRAALKGNKLGQHNLARMYRMGDAKHMGADVHQALLRMAMDIGGKAKSWIKDLRTSSRHHEDIWGMIADHVCNRLPDYSAPHFDPSEITSHERYHCLIESSEAPPEYSTVVKDYSNIDMSKDTKTVGIAGQNVESCIQNQPEQKLIEQNTTTTTTTYVDYEDFENTPTLMETRNPTPTYRRAVRPPGIQPRPRPPQVPNRKSSLPVSLFDSDTSTPTTINTRNTIGSLRTSSIETTPSSDSTNISNRIRSPTSPTKSPTDTSNNNTNTIPHLPPRLSTKVPSLTDQDKSAIHYHDQIESPTTTPHEKSLSLSRLISLSKQGVTEACKLLGNLYEDGIHIQKDISASIIYYSMTLGMQQDPEIMYRLGKLILLNDDERYQNSQDRNEDGVRILKMSAELGHPKANYALGIAYRYGLSGLAIDDKMAVNGTLKDATSNNIKFTTPSSPVFTQTPAARNRINNQRGRAAYTPLNTTSNNMITQEPQQFEEISSDESDSDSEQYQAQERSQSNNNNKGISRTPTTTTTTRSTLDRFTKKISSVASYIESKEDTEHEELIFKDVTNFTASGIYSIPDTLHSRSEIANIPSRIWNWYTPVYDYRTLGLTERDRKKPRFCGGRLSRGAFFCVHLILLTIVITAIMVPVILLVVVPKIIRDKVNDFDGNALMIDRLDILNFTSTGVRFAFESHFPPFFPLPLYVKLGEMKVSLSTTSPSPFPSDISLLDVTIPEFGFKVSEELDIKFESDCVFPDTVGTAELVRRLSSPEGIDSLGMKGSFGLTITVFGITWYHSLPVEKRFTLGKLDTKVDQVLAGLPSFIKAKNLNSLILSQFRRNDLLSFSTDIANFPLIAIEHLSMTSLDNGPQINITVAFENPTLIRLPIPSINFGIQLNNATMARISVENLNLNRSLNTLNMSIEIDLVNDKQLSSPDLVQKAIQNALDSFLNDDPSLLSLGVQGPFNIPPDTTWLSTISTPLILNLPTADLFTAFNVSTIKNTLSDSGLADLISKASLGVAILGSDIVAAVSVPIPRIIPLPKQVDIDFGFAAGILHQDLTLMKARLPMIRLFTDEDNIVVDVTATITPTNTVEAAKGLATVLNPVLSAEIGDVIPPLVVGGLSVFSSNSATMDQVAVGSLSPFDSSNVKPFAWSERLFSKLNLNVTLPHINVSSIVNGVLNGGDNGSSSKFPISLVDVVLSQTLDMPGFQASGLVGISIPQNVTTNDPVIPRLPKLRLELGYVNAGVGLKSSVKTTGATDFMNVVVDGGLNLTTTDPNVQVPMNLKALLAPPTPSLTTSLQDLVNIALTDPAISINTDSFISVSGITLAGMGYPTSSSPLIITFKDLILDISVANLRNTIGNAVDGILGDVSNAAVKGGLVQLVGADLEIRDRDLVDVGFLTVLDNPFGGVGIQVGDIELGVGINSENFAKVHVDPIQIQKNVAPFQGSLSALLTSTPSSGLKSSLSQVLNTITQGTAVTDSSPKLSIAGLTLTPRSNPSATINQLAGLTITIPPWIMNKIVTKKSSTSVIDVNRLIPSNDALKAAKIALSDAALVINPATNILQLAIAASMINPTNITLKIPYASIDLVGDNSDLMTVTVQQLNLGNGKVTIDPAISIAFKDQDSKVPVTMATLVSQFINADKLSLPIGIKSLAFGTSPTNINTLLSDSTIDVTSIIDQIPLSGLRSAIVDALPVSFPATLDDLSNDLGIKFTAINAETIPGAAIKVGVDMSMNLPFSLTVEIGNTAVGLGLTGNKILGASLPSGLQIHSKANVNTSVHLDANVVFSNAKNAQDAVSGLVSGLLPVSPTTLPSFNGAALTVMDLTLSGKTAPIMALSQVKVDLALSDIIKLNTTSPDVASFITDTLGVKILAVDVRTDSVVGSQKLGVGATLKSKNPCPPSTNNTNNEICIEPSPQFPKIPSSYPLKKNKKHPDANLKVAFVGDQGLGNDPIRVLKLIKKWGAQLVIQLGDFDYRDDPAKFIDMLDSGLGKDFPLLGVVGNHDVLKWYNGGSGYRDRLEARLKKMKDADCYGEYGVNMVCTWRGMVFVLSGVGTLGVGHADFIDATLSKYKHVPWKVCVWHKNQATYQTGDKTDETGYAVYDVCRKHGAIVATSHEHSYERTYLMSDFEKQVIAEKKSTVRIEPGKTFAFVSGLGGDSIRYWKKSNQKNPWWAAAAAMDSGTNYGALLCKFNKDGYFNKAKCRFEDIDGDVWDEFHIETKQELPSHEPLPLPPTAPISSSSLVSVNTKTNETRRHFIEVPIESAYDVVTEDLVTGTTTCAPNRMYFPSEPTTTSTTIQQPAFRHAIKFKNLPKLQSGDRVVAARLQMMGSHATEWAVEAAGFDRFVANERLVAREVKEIVVRVAGKEWEGEKRCVGDGSAKRSNSNVVVPAVRGSLVRRRTIGQQLLKQQQQQQALVIQEGVVDVDEDDESSVSSTTIASVSKAVSSLGVDETVGSVSWTFDDDGWEPGEVWISPDVTKLVAGRVEGNGNGGVTFLVEGWTTAEHGQAWGLDWKDLDRAVYGVHDELGTCLSPTLVVEVERNKKYVVWLKAVINGESHMLIGSSRTIAYLCKSTGTKGERFLKDGPS